MELTLPVELAALEGVECRLVLRDGSRPEVVLQPDVSTPLELFGSLWDQLRAALAEAGDIGEFSPGDFSLTLLPPLHWQERPPLAYADGFALLQPAPEAGGPPEARARLLAFLGVAAGRRLGLGPLAVGLGDSLAFIITAVAVGPGTDFERAMAYDAFHGSGAPPSPTALPSGTWPRARARFRRVVEQFRAWQDNPRAYAAAREQWYRALVLEVGMRVSSVEAYVARRRRGRRG